MAPSNRSGGCRRRRPSGAIPDLPAGVSAKEPQMRRWPHPTPTAAPSAAALERIEAQLYGLHCAIERQGRLLLELQGRVQNPGAPQT